MELRAIPKQYCFSRKISDKFTRYLGLRDWTAENIGPINFHEANLLNLDISKAKFNLNWQPKWSLQQTLENTIEWYKHYNSYTSSEMRNLCISQIKQYCML